jgi:uncharacterized protein (DUF58 family)
MWTMRPTARGWGLLAAGALLGGLGVGLGSTDLIRLGLIGLLVVVAGAAWVFVVDPTRGRHALKVHRSVTPNPVSAGSPATAEVRVTATDPASRVRLAEIQLGEQAASQLSGGLTLRARVERARGSITLTYPLSPVRRGRWPLGPLVARRTDPFGVVRTRAALGEPVDVAVWPEVADLAFPAGALVGEPDRVALGARTPSPDDAGLRTYRIGDDLRRVHWPSSARRGELLVRSDERAGRRPATVLMDLPADRSGIEWTVSLAASMALAALGSGHPVRLLGGRSEATRPLAASTGALAHVRDGSGVSGRAELLDRAVDLEPPPTDAEAEADLLGAAAELARPGAGHELVLAVLGPLSPRGRAALAGVADSCEAYAIVRLPRIAGAARRDAEVTLGALRRAGWHACPAEPGEDLEDAWGRLLETAR